MRLQTLKAIAGKEFRDHVRSRRFLALLAVILIISGMGMVSGTVMFQESLERYHDALTVVSGDDDPSGIAAPTRPSATVIFHMIEMTTATLAAFMGVAMGFDLVTREKEQKSLTLLLSHPVYRDEVITGKALGGVAAIALAVAIALGVGCAILLIKGIVFSPIEMIQTLIFGLFTVLFISIFFMIALFFSTISSESGTAFLSSLIILVLVAVVLPSFVYNPLVIEAVIGEPPEYPSATSEEGFSDEEISALFEEYDAENDAYWNTYHALTSTTMILSPSWNYNAVVATVTNPSENREFLTPEEIEHPDLDTILKSLMNYVENLIALLVLPVAFFGLAWVKFARMDLR